MPRVRMRSCRPLTPDTRGWLRTCWKRKRGPTSSAWAISRRSALVRALRGGSLPILKMLLRHGADPNSLEGGIVSEANFSGRRDLYETLKAAGGKEPEHPILQVEGARVALAALRSNPR